MTMASSIDSLSILAYLLAAVTQFARLFGGGKMPRSLPLALAVVGLLSQGYALFVLKTDAGQSFSLSFYAALDLASWLMLFFILAASCWLHVGSLLVIAAPLAALAVGLNLFAQGQLFLPSNLTDPLFIHIVFSFVGYTLLALTALQAIVLFFEDYALKHSGFRRWLKQFPPLQTTEFLLFFFMSLGWGLLTLSLLSGFLFVEDIRDQQLSHKVVFSLLAWVIFGFLLIKRWQFGLRGQRAIIWTLAAFILLALGYFGSKYVLEILLSQTL